MEQLKPQRSRHEVHSNHIYILVDITISKKKKKKGC